MEEELLKVLLLMKFAMIQYYWLMIANLRLILMQFALLMEWKLVKELVQVQVQEYKLDLMLMQKLTLMEGQKKCSEALRLVQNLAVSAFELSVEQVLQESDFEVSVYYWNQIVSYLSFQHQMLWVVFQQDQLFYLLQNLKKWILQYLLWLFLNQLTVYFELGKLQVEAFVIDFVLKKLNSHFLLSLLKQQQVEMKMWGYSMLIDSVLIHHK